MNKSNPKDYFRFEENEAGQVKLLIFSEAGFLPIGVFNSKTVANAIMLRIINAMIHYNIQEIKKHDRYS